MAEGGGRSTERQTHHMCGHIPATQKKTCINRLSFLYWCAAAMLNASVWPMTQRLGLKVHCIITGCPIRQIRSPVDQKHRLKSEFQFRNSAEREQPEVHNPIWPLRASLR